MANIASTNRRVRQSNLCVEIRTIQVYLSTIVMNDLAGLLCTNKSRSSIRRQEYARQLCHLRTHQKSKGM